MKHRIAFAISTAMLVGSLTAQSPDRSLGADMIVFNAQITTQIRADAEHPSPGTPIEVEVGARWTEVNGSRERIGGQWIACVVVTDLPRELVVRLSS